MAEIILSDNQNKAVRQVSDDLLEFAISLTKFLSCFKRLIDDGSINTRMDCWGNESLYSEWPGCTSECPVGITVTSRISPSYIQVEMRQ